MRDEGARAVSLTAPQVMAIGLASVAAGAAGDAARDLGYRLTPGDVGRLSSAIGQASLAMVLLVADWSHASEEALQAAARELGVLVLREVLGPPPREALN